MIGRRLLRHPTFTLGAAITALLIVQRVFGYGSKVGRWGISQLIFLYLTDAAFAAYAAAGKLLALSTVLAASVWINRGIRKPVLFLQCGFVAFLFLFVTSGFGVQYLAWLIPWCAALLPGQTRFFHLASSVYVFAIYTLLSRGFPWYLANAMETNFPSEQKGFVFLLQTICWISVGFTAYVFYRRLRDPMPAGESSSPPTLPPGSRADECRAS